MKNQGRTVVLTGSGWHCDVEDSSNILGVDYDFCRAVLTIEFKHGGGGKASRYEYDGATIATFNGLIGAPSVGKHFHAHIKPFLKHRRIPNG